MVWAAARKPPKKAYLLFDAHPAPNKGYTLRLSNMRTIKTLKREDKTPELKLIKGINILINTIAKTGLRKNNKPFIGPKRVPLLENNLIASDAGCKTPHTPTLLGPTRNCLIDNTFRSNKVTNATFNNTLRIIINISSLV